MNHKAEILIGTVIFIILNVIFFISILAFVLRASSGSMVIEEIYAKKIALSVDSLKPGTEVNISLEEPYKFALKNKYSGRVVIPDLNKGLITVKITDKGEGYSFKYFTTSSNLYFDSYDKEKRIVIGMKK